MFLIAQTLQRLVVFSLTFEFFQVSGQLLIFIKSFELFIVQLQSYKCQIWLILFLLVWFEVLVFDRYFRVAKIFIQRHFSLVSLQTFIMGDLPTFDRKWFLTRLLNFCILVLRRLKLNYPTFHKYL
jgi:hypothetical protein